MSKSKVQRKKTVRAQPPHKCSCCGKVGHNIEQCPSPAAKELLHLRAAVKGFLEGAPQKRIKGRVPVKKNTKSEDYRKQAKEEQLRTQLAKGIHIISLQVQWWMDAVLKMLKLYIKELVSFGFICGCDKGCKSCGAALGEAEKYKANGKLYFRCTSWKCQKRHNVTDFSLFHGTRLSLVDLCRVITLQQIALDGSPICC